MNDFPRRNRLDLNTPAEKAIYDAIQEVEKVGADTRLTGAVIKLSEARNLVADFIDGIAKPQPTFLERLKTERIELKERFDRLNAFNQSEKADLIDPIQKSLLLVQAGAMYTYLEVLNSRLDRL